MERTAGCATLGAMDTPRVYRMKPGGGYGTREARVDGRLPEVVAFRVHPDHETAVGDLGGEFDALLGRGAGIDRNIRIAVQDALERFAETHGTRLYIPHGAVVGLEALAEGRDQWEEVTMVMRKSPSSIDFSEHPTLTADGITEDTVIYEGPTRGICPLFPRNVNAHAALALGGIGFDRTRSVLIAVTDSHTSDIEITARGEAADLTIRRVSPMKGVSGIFTLISALGSVVRAKSPGSGLQIC